MVLQMRCAQNKTRTLWISSACGSILTEICFRANDVTFVKSSFRNIKMAVSLCSAY